MNLVEQSAWWLLPYALLMLVMVHAMMEFTVSLLQQRAPAGRAPIAGDELRRRLLALNDPAQPHRLVEGSDCDLEIFWATEQAPPRGRFVVAKRASTNRLRFLLDEQRHELRMNQVSQAYGCVFGLVGWLPTLEAYFSAQSGPPGQSLSKEISRTAQRAGWHVRPVVWWFQATRRGYRILELLTPAPLRRWPARRFWGILYPLSYAMGMGTILAIIGPLERDNLWILIGVSAGWWGIWGLLVWALRGFPAFWRRRRR